MKNYEAYYKEYLDALDEGANCTLLEKILRKGGTSCVKLDGDCVECHKKALKIAMSEEPDSEKILAKQEKNLSLIELLEIRNMNYFKYFKELLKCFARHHSNREGIEEFIKTFVKKNIRIDEIAKWLKEGSEE